MTEKSQIKFDRVLAGQSKKSMLSCLNQITLLHLYVSHGITDMINGSYSYL